MKPIRVQRKRTKGWKMPNNTTYVGRPGKWGNPFTGEGAVEKFSDCILNNAMCYCHLDEIEATVQYYRFKWMSEHIYVLRGRNIACFCPIDKPCHGDVLLEYANQPSEALKTLNEE